MKMFILGFITCFFSCWAHGKILNYLTGDRYKYRIWPFISQPFYNLKNRFFYNFLWPILKARADKAGKYYKDTDLIYAAYVRCECGAGMAYHRGTGSRGAWDCSDILTGRAPEIGKPGAVTHTGRMPFLFYEIKSEDQPSAFGATTRQKVNKDKINETR
jgi:hypothetical protein